LEVAREKYQVAKAARDEKMMGDEMRSIDALRAIISDLELEVVAEREATGQQAATARLLRIKRAIGSVVSELDEDERRLDELLAEAITRLNDRYDQATKLRAEALALSDRFDLPTPTLPDVVSPARRAIAVEVARALNKLRADAGTWQANEQCEHKMRTRRTYAEADGTPGAEIIAAAGLKPFPELREDQREALASKEREREEMRRQFAGYPTNPSSSI
jgi:EAL domain-containing protein (putative c-di-GMP-specific phosphodiesterase class I)